ncbi:MAG: hypothetical protein QMD14_01920 [Candidatus Aenigmarchaeota archaeon]|nr:hypothetical protein [Candidatus Aenigmarchaeota archaeon]
MSFFTFGSLDELRSFLGRKIHPQVVEEVEYFVMERFPIKKVLFTAEHAVSKEIPMKEYGKNAYIVIGDKNTDTLAKLAAYYIKSAYVATLFSRIDADAARDTMELGKGLRLFVRVFNSEKQPSIYVPIHSNKSYLSNLRRYHRVIEELNPKTIISIHGMHVGRKFDMLFGFDKNYGGIGGKENAFRFKREFISFLDGVFSELGIRNNLEIAVSTWLFTGSRNYVLTKHVIEHNKKSKEKRIGMQVEFNWKGRVGEIAIPTIPYQVAVQALADFITKWKM